MKKGMVNIDGESPMQFSEGTEEVALLTNQQQIVDQVGQAVKAYIKAVSELLDGQYAVLREVLPPHFSNPGNVFVSCCTEGVVIRHDRKMGDETKLRVSWSDEPLPVTVAVLSQRLVRCVSPVSQLAPADDDGVEVALVKK